MKARRNKNFTEFEKKVYEAVSNIPKGEVRSYGWVARAIGRPRSYRAVGNALNKNLYPEIIPCHRVIRSDGSIGGYAKGMRAKRKLLMAEGLDCPMAGCYNHKKESSRDDRRT